VVRPLQPPDETALHALLARYPYHDYRTYPRMPPDAGFRMLRSDFARGGDRVATVGVWRGDAMVAAGFLERLPWDSKHFGLAMGRLGPLVTDADAGPAPRAALIEWLLARAQDAGLEHLAVKVDGAELGVLQALEARGFRLVDCLVTYLADFHRDPVPMKQLGAIREYRVDDLEAVVAIAERKLAEYGGRFASDPWLPREAVRRFYVEWVRNACAGDMADRVLVAERHGRIVGFLAYGMLARPLKELGVRIAGHGLSAVLPEGTGVYPGLIANGLASDRIAIYDLGEFETSIQNIAPQLIFQRLGFRPARFKYALHRCRP
jgi:hypothetical protein